MDYTDKELKLHVRRLGVKNNRTMKRVMITSEEGYDITEVPYMVQNNVLTVVVPKMSSVLFVTDLV